MPRIFHKKGDLSDRPPYGRSTYQEHHVWFGWLLVGWTDTSPLNRVRDPGKSSSETDRCEVLIGYVLRTRTPCLFGSVIRTWEFGADPLDVNVCGEVGKGIYVGDLV